MLILGILVVALVLGQAGPAPSPTSAPSLSPVAVGGDVPSASVLTSPPPTPSPSAASSKPLPSPSPTATPAPPWKAVHCKGTEPDDHASARAPDYTSTTWAGYINTKSNGKLVTCIEGAWVVPNAKCVAKGPSQDVFIWVGIGGWSSPFTGVNHRLEQVGVEIFYPPGGGPARYFAWHEATSLDSLAVRFYGLDPFVHAGSHVWAQVRYTQGAFAMTLANLDTKAVYSWRQVVPHAARTTAEWIVEAPTLCPNDKCGTEQYRLANFGHLPFTGCLAVIGGHAGTIGTSSWVRWPVNTLRKGIIRAKTGPLTDGGRRFTISWAHT